MPYAKRWCYVQRPSVEFANLVCERWGRYGGENALQTAVHKNNGECVKVLLAQRSFVTVDHLILKLAQCNSLDMLNCFHDFDVQVQLNGGQAATHWSYQPRDAMNIAAGRGLLDVIWFHENRTEGCSTNAMDRAAGNGHLTVVIWLSENRSEGCTSCTMDCAAGNGHLAVVEWLHLNRSEGCTTIAMDGADIGGHLELVQWLHTNRNEGCSTKAMDEAAAWGHLEIVQWLHTNRHEGCTSAAMDRAAQGGFLEVVKWLHENRQEGCTTYAIDNTRNLQVMKWLRANRSEGCTPAAIERALTSGDLPVVYWLHSNYPQCIPRKLRQNRRNVRFSLLLFYRHHYPVQFNPPLYEEFNRPFQRPVDRCRTSIAYTQEWMRENCKRWRS